MPDKRPAGDTPVAAPRDGGCAASMPTDPRPDSQTELRDRPGNGEVRASSVRCWWWISILAQRMTMEVFVDGGHQMGARLIAEVPGERAERESASALDQHVLVPNHTEVRIPTDGITSPVESLTVAKRSSHRQKPHSSGLQSFCLGTTPCGDTTQNTGTTATSNQVYR